MIYGDTGWRALVEWGLAGNIITGSLPEKMVGKLTPSGMPGGLYLRRIMNQVIGYFVGDIVTDTSDFNFVIPLSYRPNSSVHKAVSRTMATSTLPPDGTPVLQLAGARAYFRGLRIGMSAGGDIYPTAGTQWNYLVDQEWPDATSTYTPKNTTILP